MATSDSSNPTFHTVNMFLPEGASFTSFSGEMIAPTLKQKSITYLWPGIQPPSDDGVYQNVLSGATGSWTLFSLYCCDNPTLPWGSDIAIQDNEPTTFTNTLRADGNWEGTIAGMTSQNTATDSFPVGDKLYNQVLWAVELWDGAPWNFGTLSFRNINLTATGTTDTTWCDNGPQSIDGRTVFTSDGVSSSVDGNGGVACSIEKIDMIRPEDGTGTGPSGGGTSSGGETYS